MTATAAFAALPRAAGLLRLAAVAATTLRARMNVVTATSTSAVTATGTMTVSGTTTVSAVTATASGAAAPICGMSRHPWPWQAVTMRRLTDTMMQ